MTPKQALLQRMEEMSVSPKRSLGQNFLINQNVIDKIISRAMTLLPAKVIEVGPGLGALTEPALTKAWDITLIEMDKEFIKYWKKRSLDLVEGDALKVDWEKFKFPPNTLFLSNLPYQISARIVIERSVGPTNIQHMILMFQKEVAQRITSQPKTKDYGFLTVVAQAAWKVNKLCDVGPGDFYPKPRVASRVLVFGRQREIPEEFVQFVKKAFTNRRKMMLKALQSEKDWLLPHLETLGYNEKVRAEEISPEHFWQMYERKINH